jgi:hypothetical protein
VDSGLLISFSGSTGYTYSVQRTLTLAGPWGALGTATVNSNGVASFLDANWPTNSAFYRTTYP